MAATAKTTKKTTKKTMTKTTTTRDRSSVAILEEIKEFVSKGMLLQTAVHVALLDEIPDIKWEKIAGKSKEVQWLLVMNPEMDGKLAKDLAYYVHFGKTGHINYSNAEELLEQYNGRAVVAALEHSCPIEVADSVPWWAEKFPEAYVNGWISNSGISETGFRGLTTPEKDFLISTNGFGDLDGDIEFELKIAECWDSEEGFVLSRALGRVVDSLENDGIWGEGLSQFNQGLLIKLDGSSLLEQLREKEVEQGALINLEDFWSRCDFNSFTEIPEIMLKKWEGELPTRCIFNADNLHFLSEPNAEFCIHYGSKEKGEGISVAFKLLERPMSEWHQMYGDEAWKYLAYDYPWNAESIPLYDMVTEMGLTLPIADAANEIFDFIGLSYYVGEVDSRQCYKKAIELYRSGMLRKIVNILRSSCVYRDDVVQYFEQYLTLGFAGLHYPNGKEHDFIESLEIAERHAGEYSCELALLWLNLLDENRYEEDGKLYIIVDEKTEDGWRQRIIKDGENPDGHFLWGVTCAPKQVRLVDGKTFFVERPTLS